MFNRPTYERLLTRLQVAKVIIKDLLSKSEFTTLHYHGLRNAYGC